MTIPQHHANSFPSGGSTVAPHLRETRVLRASLSRQHFFAVAFLLLTHAASYAQTPSPDLTGLWRPVRITRGPLSKDALQIEQTRTTFSFRSIPSIGPKPPFIVFPTDGIKFRSKRWGHMESWKTGRWTNGKLILEQSGEGNLPWHRSTSSQIFSPSPDAKTLSLEINEGRSPGGSYTIFYEKLNPTPSF